MPNAERADVARRVSSLRLAAKRVDPQAAGRARFPGQEASPAAALAPDLVEIRIRLEGEHGLIEARRQARALAIRGGFKLTDRAVIAAILSELGRNVLQYAAEGEIAVSLFREGERVGLSISASDRGPGIADIDQAMRDGYSSCGRPGLGLPGVRRLADDFGIVCVRNEGTTVTVKKWRN